MTNAEEQVRLSHIQAQQMEILGGEISYRSMMELSKVSIKAFNTFIKMVQEATIDPSSAQMVQAIVPQFVFEIAGILGDNTSVMSAATDPLRSVDERIQFLNIISDQIIDQMLAQLVDLDGKPVKVKKSLVDGIDTCRNVILQASLALSWNSQKDLINALVEIGVLLAIHNAEIGSKNISDEANRSSTEASSDTDVAEESSVITSRIIEQLTNIQSELVEHPVLQEDLSNSRVSSQVRGELWDNIFSQETMLPVVRILAKEATVHLHERRYMKNISWFISIAAFYTNESLVVVTSAVPLTIQQRARIQSIWTEKIGFKVQLSELVDPRVMGGVRVQHGQEIVDSTVVSQLQKLGQYFNVNKT